MSDKLCCTERLLDLHPITACLTRDKHVLETSSSICTSREPHVSDTSESRELRSSSACASCELHTPETSAAGASPELHTSDAHASRELHAPFASSADASRDLHSASTDTFSTIRRNCEQHLRRLERYKKARSFCSLQDACSTSSCAHAEQAIPAVQQTQTTKELQENGKMDPQFEELRVKMFSLMENDMLLLAKLLQLGETLRELRASQQQPAECSNTAACSEAENEEENEAEDQFRPLRKARRPRRPIPPEFGAPVTRLYLGDDEDEEERSDHPDDDEDEDEMRPNVQYFSRKNSVLRIPIPPRASNRNFARPKQLRPRNARQQATCVRESRDDSQQSATEIAAVADTLDSGHSSASEHASSTPTSHSPPAAATGSSRFSTFSSCGTCASSLTSSSSNASSRRAKSMERK